MPSFRKQGTAEENLFFMSGWIALVSIPVILLVLAGILFKTFPPLMVVVPMLGLVCLKGFTILSPNESMVAVFFGTYSGTLSENGFFWVNPLLSCSKVSTKSNNHVTPVMKVNDGNGNPIEISAAVVWHVDNPAAAVFDVENLAGFVKAQSEGAVRALASSHPYDSETAETSSLRRQAEPVLEELRLRIQERLAQAGIRVEEARFTHLAYAPEIAQAMLRKQQAQSVVAARTTIVEGAIGMVQRTVEELESKGILKMDDKDKARLVTNMLTVLLSETAAAPVVSVGTASD